MKANIEGMELEGTSEEIIDIIRKLREKQVVHKPVKEVVCKIDEAQTVTTMKTGRGPRGHYRKRKVSNTVAKDHLEEMKEYILEHGGSIGGICTKILGYADSRKCDLLRKRLKKEGIIVPKYREYKPDTALSEQPKRDKGADQRVQRGKFMLGRMNYLMRSQGLTREKAYAYASQEYSTHGQKQHFVTETALPTDEPIISNDNNTNKILLETIKMMIANSGSMTYYNEGKSLRMNEPEWVSACYKILDGQNQINEYFFGKGRFVLTGVGTKIVVKYER